MKIKTNNIIFAITGNSFLFAGVLLLSTIFSAANSYVTESRKFMDTLNILQRIKMINLGFFLFLSVALIIFGIIIVVYSSFNHFEQDT